VTLKLTIETQGVCDCFYFGCVVCVLGLMVGWWEGGRDIPQFRYYERLLALDDYFDRFSFRPRRLSRSTRSPHVCVYSHIAVTVKQSTERARARAREREREFRRQRVSEILISVHRRTLLGAFDKIAKSEY